MELTKWQSQRMESSLEFILKQRADQTGKLPEIIELQVADDTSNKSVVIKLSNAIFSESTKNSNFIVVLYINQYNRDGLLHELLDALTSRDYCKVFFVDELIVNPIGNKMVPKHKLCTRIMVEKLLCKRSITIDALPKIFLRDPIVRWYGWKIGDVIKITRPNGELYYRIVVE
jgi:DNA-directed RNA polymerase subunit H (RpoH/RPB5)